MEWTTERPNGRNVELRKLSEFAWELPQTDGMLVPGIIYTSEKLLARMREDRTLLQLKNVAMLPGIIKHAVAMPDAHEGYGFPIGGVAAFDMQKGVISPGGIGYDINCLTGDARILDELGRHRAIKEFLHVTGDEEIEIDGMLMKKLHASALKTFNATQKIFEPKRAGFWMKKGTADIYQITLKSGITIKATADHPFLTKLGMRPVSEIKHADVAVHFFDGVPHDEASERQIRIARIVGYVLGDGCLYYSRKKGFVHAYGKKEDLETLQKDIISLGYSAKIYSRDREHSITSQYGTRTFSANECALHCSSTQFAKLMQAAGVPEGNKTRTEYGVPDWIIEAPKSVKRAFLAGFFGAELSSPKTSSKTGFYTPTISQNKIEEYGESTRYFLLGIAMLLKEFDVNVTKISERDEFANQYGEKTKRYRLLISAQEDNLLRLWRTVGFEFNKKRSQLAEIAVSYILTKKKDNARRVELAKEIKDLKRKGFKIGELKKLYTSKINERFIERHFYEDAGQRISLQSMSFEDFKALKTKEIEVYGTLFDTVESITHCGKEEVYDFNVEDNHTFIANSFIVSNCGVRLLRTDLTFKDIKDKRSELLDELYRNVPCGVGKDTRVKLTREQFHESLSKGARWSLEQGYATARDLDHTEENGNMEAADSSLVSTKALQRGAAQIGTLGSGNHFLELQKVDKIFNPEAAKAFGIKKEGQITVMIHCGSRGFGHQVASDYLQTMEEKFGHAHLPDRELACAPLQSEVGQKYYKAMCAAVNFAFANRQMITHNTRKSFKKVLGSDDGMDLVYDVCHNIAKFEEHEIDGKKTQVCVHRKGATRSFGPGRKEIPAAYRKIGQPVFIPGSMGTASYVLIGTNTAEQASFGSTAHGAGRVMSRAEATRTWRGEQIRDKLASQDIILKAASWKGVAEEAAEAYKDIDEVAKVSHGIGIGGMVARLVPVAVMKG